MIQRRFVVMMTMILMHSLTSGCDHGEAPQASTTATKIRVASLSPAATDLIVAMGLGDQLVAVSNYEPPREITDHLPRIGDYRTTEWEKIAQLKPDLLITQYRSDKMPEGFTDRAAALGIKVFNRKIDSLDDTLNTIGELGQQLNAPDAAVEAARRWNAAMQNVRDSVSDKPRRRVLLIVGESGLAAVGPNTFLSDLLEIAGGENVLTSGIDYPTLDRERLAALNPDVVIQLLPGASPQIISESKSFWPTMPEIKAVKNNDIHQVSNTDVLLPGFGVTNTVKLFEAILHGNPTTRKD